MKKARILTWTGCLLFGISIYLDSFTQVPKYVAGPLLGGGLIVVLLGLRETRRFSKDQKPLTGKRRHLTFAWMLALVTIGVIVGLYANSRSNLNFSFRTEVVVAAITLLCCGGIIYWRVYRRPIPDGLTQFPKRWVVLIGVATLFFVLSTVFEILDRDSEATRRVDHDIGKAVASMEKKTPGIDRANDLIRDLRAIDTHGAPADVRFALSEYAKALDDGISTVKSGGNATLFDPIIAEKNKALQEAIKKHK